MAPSSVNDERDRDAAATAASTAAAASSASGSGPDPEAEATIGTATLLEQLQADRVWLLQQIDGGRWPDLRLDLAALERALGQLLEQAQRQHGAD
ncbi:MAG: hypothetical protein ACKO0M_09260 [Cyanobium sp.]